MISYQRRGSGSPVVLVHGLGSRWQVWEPVLDRVAAHHDVIAVDLPGFGDSAPVPDVAPGAPGYAAWLTDWLTDLGIERPHVVGNSMGGGIALEMGRSGAASRVTAFAPIGFWATPGRVWTQSYLTTMRATVRTLPGVTDRLLELGPTRTALMAGFFGRPSRVSAVAARADVAGLASSPAFPAARDSFTSYRFEAGDRLGRLPEIPVTVAWGTRDVVLTHRTQSARAARALPFARHVDLDRCGHLPFNDDPERCAAIILEQS